jgi:hypothetical protein
VAIALGRFGGSNGLLQRLMLDIFLQHDFPHVLFLGVLFCKEVEADCYWDGSVNEFVHIILDVYIVKPLVR